MTSIYAANTAWQSAQLPDWAWMLALGFMVVFYLFLCWYDR